MVNKVLLFILKSNVKLFFLFRYFVAYISMKEKKKVEKIEVREKKKNKIKISKLGDFWNIEN